MYFVLHRPIYMYAKNSVFWSTLRHFCHLFYLINEFRRTKHFYTVSQKKQDTKLLAITSPTIIRFKKKFSLADSVVNLQQTHV